MVWLTWTPLISSEHQFSYRSIILMRKCTRRICHWRLITWKCTLLNREDSKMLCVWNCQEEIIFEMSAIEWALKWSLMARIRRPFSRYRSLTSSSDLASLRYMSRSLLVGLTHTVRVYPLSGTNAQMVIKSHSYFLSYPQGEKMDQWRPNRRR